MTPSVPGSSTERKLEQLRSERRRLLGLSPESTLEAILSAPEPTPLVHSFTEQDLYFLIHDIGPEDAQPLVAMASEKQLDFILDQEIWDKDRFDLSAAVRWFEVMIRADPPRLIPWLIKNHLPTVELFLFKSLEFRIREHDQDPSELGEGFFSFDNTFYMRFTPPPSEEDGTDQRRQRHFDSLSTLLKQMAETDYLRFQSLILESSAQIPAECEEEAYRLRNVRLGERGFLPFEEAVGIYQPLRIDQLRPRSQGRAPHQNDTTPQNRVPISLSMTVDAESVFEKALEQVESPRHVDELRLELAALSNRMAVADLTPIQSRSDLRPIVRKVCGYLSIGLEHLASRSGHPSHPLTADASRWLSTYGLNDIFRLGYAQALTVKWKADRWLPESWFARMKLPISFWGETWMGVLGGLLIKRPRFCDHYRSGTLYREFETLAEIEDVATELNRIQEMDRLLSFMGITSLERKEDLFLTYRNLLLTLWARHELGLSDNAVPIAISRFRPFFEELFPGQPSSGEAIGRSPAPEMKNRMLNWLVEQTGRSAEAIGKAVGDSLEALFQELGNEYGSVPVGRLEPRFVHLFLLKT
ncbi:MAG: DUF6178 family protein [Desulfobacterales bacterium]|jgi:hypothetical protein